MIRTLLAVVLGASISAHVGVADAKCASPGVSFAPVDGATVALTKRRATSWVFVPSWRGEPTIEVSSAEETDVVIERVSKNDTFATYQVTVTFAKRTGAYAISAGSAGVRYQTGKVSGTQGGPTTLSNPSHTSDAWTCSHNEFVSATPSIEAPAYRIEWAQTESDYANGERESLVVPAHRSMFWGREATAAEISLGHHSCFGETLLESALRSGVFVGVSALATGDESTPEQPTYIEVGDTLVFTTEPTAEPEPPVCGLPLTSHELPAVSPEPVVAPTASSTPSRRLALLGMLFGLLLGISAVRRLGPAALRRLDARSIPQLAVALACIPATMSQSITVSSTTSLATGFAAFAVGTFASVIAAVVQKTR